MVYYRYLGYGVTDSNGIAKLDHDANGDPISHSYTGTGAGEIDVVASLDSTIGSGSLLSETYEVIDGILSDINGSGNIDYTTPVSATIQRNSDGTLLTASTVGTQGYTRISTNHTNNYNFKDIGEFVLAFDVLSYEGDCIVEATANNGSTTHWLFSGNIAETGHYEFYFKANEQYKMINGTKVPIGTRTLSEYTNYIYITIITKNNFKLNNIVVYPI